MYWLIAIGVSFWLYGLMIRSSWIEWAEDPVTFSYTEKPMKIDTIPFPKVTFCPEIKARAFDFFRNTAKEFNLTAALLSLPKLSDVE